SVHIPPTVNPFPQTGGVPITTPVPIYQVYTPKHSASGSIDYEHEVTAGGAMSKLHLDGNYDSGFYVNYTDANYDNNTRAVRYPQVKGESGSVFNGRIASADIPSEANGAKVTVASWARNLFNEQHSFYKTGSAAAGISGFFNDPRTRGAEINGNLPAASAERTRPSSTARQLRFSTGFRNGHQGYTVSHRLP
ncbi:hypothetical protein OY671_009228, partial [Metschnikowia pulcherrima]